MKSKIYFAYGNGIGDGGVNILTDMKIGVDKCFLICYSKYNS